MTQWQQFAKSYFIIKVTLSLTLQFNDKVSTSSDSKVMTLTDMTVI